MHYHCQGLIKELCVDSTIHAKFDSHQTTCYFSEVKISKSITKLYCVCNVFTVAILHLIINVCCSWGNNYGKGYNHDASTDDNNRSELSLSSSEQETSAVTEKPTWRHVASHSLHCLRDIRLRTVRWFWKWGLRSLKVIESATIW